MDSQSDRSLPKIFKGIALFTPGGDLIYCIDTARKARWHLNLCLELQSILGLRQPPYFLLPGYTATVDRWLDLQTGKVQVSASVYPAVKRYIPLLQVLFETKENWQVSSWEEEYCNPAIIETYREDFYQLWEERDLIVCLNSQNNSQNFAEVLDFSAENKGSSLDYRDRLFKAPNHFILHLFVAKDSVNMVSTLDSIHQLLEKGLTCPYTLKIIDIKKHPEQAEINHISATPTLIRVSPKPIKKVVGDFGNFDRVLQIITS